MSIEELKRIQITDLLASLGHQPVSKSRGGRQLLYHSPLRPDNNASFSVSADRNLWYDFGAARGGDVIDLAKALNAGCSFRAAAEWLESECKKNGNESLELDRWKNQVTDRDPGMENVKVVPLAHKALLDYLQSRCIPEHIAKRYCKEVNYTVRGRDYFGVCFMNILGGMEIRNPFFKGGYGVKAPSIIYANKEKRSSSCCVFEGFMDFLSYQTLYERKDDRIVQPVPCDCVVMNSTSLVKQVIPFLKIYDLAFCYFDNDKAGQYAYSEIQVILGNRANSESYRYTGMNDLNDFINCGFNV